MPATQSIDKAGSTGTGKPRRSTGLAVIDLYKAAKTIGLILVAIAAFHLDQSQDFERLVH